MILLFDVGNTNITFAYYDGQTYSQIYRLNTIASKTADEYYLNIISLIGKKTPIHAIAIASVVPRITSTLAEVSIQFFHIKPLVLEAGIKTGINVIIDNIKEVGADLFCSAAAVEDEETPHLIVDLGTATKYIYVHRRVIEGVIIIPGVKISIKALVGTTALLPDIELIAPKKVLGNNTISCMQSGMTYGVAAQIDGLIARIKKEVKKDFKVILTGGLSSLIAPLVEHELVLDDYYVLKGLLNIYDKNTRK